MLGPSRKCSVNNSNNKDNIVIKPGRSYSVPLVDTIIHRSRVFPVLAIFEIFNNSDSCCDVRHDVTNIVLDCQVWIYHKPVLCLCLYSLEFVTNLGQSRDSTLGEDLNSVSMLSN